MTEKLTATLYNPQQGYQQLLNAWTIAKSMLMAGHRMVLTIKPETRTLSQNNRLWAMLTDVSNQVDWYGRKLTPEDWKHVMSASLKKQDVVPGIDGGFVVLGLSTSKMTKSELGDLMTLIEAFGANHGVKFTAQEQE
jgi:hypothetical protein